MTASEAICHPGCSGTAPLGHTAACWMFRAGAAEQRVRELEAENERLGRDYAARVRRRERINTALTTRIQELGAENVALLARLAIVKAMSGLWKRAAKRRRRALLHADPAAAPAEGE